MALRLFSVLISFIINNKGAYNLAVSEITINIPVSHESNVSGAFDSNIKIIEKSIK